MKFYHGSKSRLVGAIAPTSRDVCDFGRGTLETASWRELAKKLEKRKNGGGKPGGHDGEGVVVTLGDEWLVGEKPNVTFDDIAGMEDAKRVIDEMVLYPMKSPEKARALGLNPGGGVLLFGPPGTGKTMLGKAIAGALDAPFYYASRRRFLRPTRSSWKSGSNKQLGSGAIMSAKHYIFMI